MPLLRGLARTAAIAGTATAVSNRVSRRQAGRWARQDAQQEPQPAQQQPPPGASAPQSSGTDAKLSQLKQLGELHSSGVLSDQEFEQQKTQILSA